MYQTLKVEHDGFVQLPLKVGASYVVTRWYGSSLAIFEDGAFQKYIRRLDMFLEGKEHGNSVIRYFLSSAVTILNEVDQKWQLPEFLVHEVMTEGAELVYGDCIITGRFDDCWPTLLIASAVNMDNAMKKTAEHQKKE